MLLRLADPEGRYAAVRLSTDLRLPEEQSSFARHDGEWRLEITLPAVSRLEYAFEVVHDDGGAEHVCDPTNPHRAPGAFGEKSVLLLPGYEPPRWLDEEGVPGRTDAIAVVGRGLGAEVHADIWSPADTDPAEPLPLLVAHDGPEYDALSRLTQFAAAGIAADRLPPLRIALLAPGERDEWYSASARYAGALVRDVIPGILQAVNTAGRPVGMGASLGALAMLHAQRRHPGVFGGLFLQSGSFFTPRFDAHESGFPRYQRIVRFVRSTLRGATPDLDKIPAVLTCGAPEENVYNNRLTARALAVQGYDAALHENPDMHNYTAWRDTFDPHLTGLLARSW